MVLTLNSSEPCGGDGCGGVVLDTRHSVLGEVFVGFPCAFLMGAIRELLSPFYDQSSIWFHIIVIVHLLI